MKIENWLFLYVFSFLKGEECNFYIAHIATLCFTFLYMHIVYKLYLFSNCSGSKGKRHKGTKEKEFPNR